MTDKPSIYQALAAVMADCDHVAKRDRNDFQKFMFRGIDAVVNAVGPILRKHAVIVVPQVQSIDYQVVQTTKGNASTACRVRVKYVFYGPAGDSIETEVAGEAWDSGDKATPKAMSVAFRTALLQALALPTDEPDPDAHTYTRAAATPLTDNTRKRLFALFGERQIPEEQQLAGINQVLGTTYESRKQLTEEDAQHVIASLKGSRS